MINIENIIDQYLAEKRIEDAKTHNQYSGLIYATQLKQCHRRQFYGINKIEPTNPPDERTLRVWACGELFEKFVSDIVISKGLQIISQNQYKDDEVSLRVDLLGEDAVYELKSQHSRKFWHIQKELALGKTIEDFQPDHVYQVLLGALKHNKEWACLVYISKDDLCLKQFNFKTETLKPKIDEEILAIKNIMKFGELPAPEPRLYGDKIDKDLKCPQECAYCNWRDRCFSEEELRDPGEAIDHAEWLLEDR